MSSLSFLLHLLDIVMLVPMVVDSPIPPYFYFSNARLTSSLLLSVRFDFIQFYIKVLSSLISERSHLIIQIPKSRPCGSESDFTKSKRGVQLVFYYHYRETCIIRDISVDGATARVAFELPSGEILERVIRDSAVSILCLFYSIGSVVCR